MANTTLVKIRVNRLGKYGFFADGIERGINYSSKFNEADKPKIVPGAEFDGELYVSDAGAQYLNRIVSFTPASVVTPKVVKEETKEVKKAFKPTYTKKEDTKDSPMTREDWDAKDKRISRQGVIQAAVQALAPIVSLELLPEEAVKLADRMLEYVNKKG